MKFGQLIEYNKRNIFSSKIMKKLRQTRLVQNLVLFLKKPQYEVKASPLQPSFNIFR